jgi:hypothetical protein
MSFIPDNPYLTRVGFYLTKDSLRRARTFRDAAQWWKDNAEGVVLQDFFDAHQFLEVADCFDDKSVSQLAVFAHGTPTALGRPGRFGLDVRAIRHRPPVVYSVEEFAEHWAPKLVDGALISLAACLCARDPKWYRVQLWGRDFSAWSAKSYEKGGSLSFSSKLARAFRGQGRRVKVRGHCAAGHTIHQALLREHTGDGRGRALFGIVHGDGVVPERPLRRQWQRVVKGELAARWLLGINDGETVRMIRERLGI